MYKSVIPAHQSQVRPAQAHQAHMHPRHTHHTHHTQAQRTRENMLQKLLQPVSLKFVIW